MGISTKNFQQVFSFIQKTLGNSIQDIKLISGRKKQYINFKKYCNKANNYINVAEQGI